MPVTRPNPRLYAANTTVQRIDLTSTKWYWQVQFPDNTPSYSVSVSNPEGLAYPLLFLYFRYSLSIHNHCIAERLNCDTPTCPVLQDEDYEDNIRVVHYCTNDLLDIPRLSPENIVEAAQTKSNHADLTLENISVQRPARWTHGWPVVLLTTKEEAYSLRVVMPTLNTLPGP